MVVDVGIVRKHIKPKADSTLCNMRKVDLIAYIRTLEHNYNVAVSFNENQAKYIESLGFTGVVKCKDCKHSRVASFGERYCNRDKTVELGELKEDDFCSYGEKKGE